jgi:hypothetical protein
VAGPIVIVAVTAVVVATALAGLFVVRKVVPTSRLSRYADVSGYVYAVIGVMYGVILAQVVVAAWDDFESARNYAASEANAVLSLDRLSRGWPATDRDAVHNALAIYATTVIEVEWPAMARGDFSSTVDTDTVDDLWAAYRAAALGPVGSQPSFAASLDQLDELTAARRERVLLGQTTLPQTMTATLLLGAVVTIGFSYLFAIEDSVLHGLLTSSLAVLIALLLLLVAQLQTPFQGVDSLRPAAMQSVLDDIRASDR